MTSDPDPRQVADRIREETAGEILQLKENINGVLVVQQLAEGSIPNLYRVTLEKQIDGSESLHRVYLGPVNDSQTEGGDERTETAL
jgi:hypothetical protein